MLKRNIFKWECHRCWLDSCASHLSLVSKKWKWHYVKMIMINHQEKKINRISPTQLLIEVNNHYAYMTFTKIRKTKDPCAISCSSIGCHRNAITLLTSCHLEQPDGLSFSFHFFKYLTISASHGNRLQRKKRPSKHIKTVKTKSLQ